MTLRALVDNDILIKGACYGSLEQMAKAIPLQCHEVGVLGAAPFVVRSRIRHANLKRDWQQAMTAFDVCLSYVNVIEPTEAELFFAAELETLAQRLQFSLDAGESQLCSILIHRGLDWLITGDKRAVSSFEQLLRAGADLLLLSGKVVCLEQVFFSLFGFHDVNARNLVCAEPAIDRALTIICACNGSSTDVKSWMTGLRSYIEHLRAQAPTILSQA